MVFYAILAILLGFHIIVWVWAARRLRDRKAAAIALHVWMAALGAFLAAFPLAPDFARNSHAWLPRWFIALGYTWGLLVAPVWIGVLALLAPLRLRKKAAVAERRSFLVACAAWTPPALATAGTLVSVGALDDFRVRRVDVPVPDLPERLEGLRIAHVSDLHCGKFTTDAALADVVDRVNGLAPDLVLMTGDLIDLSLRDLPRALEVVKSFTPDGGVYLCEGNHDLIDDGRAFRRRVREADVPLLVREVETVRVRGERIQLVGAPWARGDAAMRESMLTLREKRDPDRFPILLAHHPHLFDHADGFPVVFSGHTHGGQLMWNEELGAGPVLFRYWSGVYERDGRHLVVSNGAGNWFPLRTAAPAEILDVRLVRA